MKGWIAAALCMLASVAVADEKTIGSWTFKTYDEGAIASTASDSGGILGIYCSFSSRQCEYFFNPNLECTEGGFVPLLIAGDDGATATRGKCVHFSKDTHVLALETSLDDIVASSGTVGFAIAMRDGKFQVMRFNMNGSIQTITRAKEATKQHPSDAAFPETTSGDIVL